jgi:hypothetical protein
MFPIYTFISTGEKTALYTLRCMYEVPVVIQGVNRVILKDYHVQNLSNDKAVAEEKAEYLSAQIGVPFKGNAEFDLNEIRRRKSEEVAAQREAVERAIKEAEEKLQAEYVRSMQEGVLLCGKYRGMSPSEVEDVDYLRWMASQTDLEAPEGLERSKWSISCQIAAKWLKEHPVKESEWVGEVGDKINLHLKLCKIYFIQGQWPTILYKCITEDGDSVVFYTVASGFSNLIVGEWFDVTGTVKKLDEYKGVKQTVLNRPKLVK